MKKFSILSLLLSLLMMTSCAEKDILRDDTNDLKNEYTKFWIKKFGLIDSQQNWNMATSASAVVNPSAYPNGSIVKIYSNSGANKGKLIGYATRQATLKLDVVKGATDIYAEVLDKNKQTVCSGVYDIRDGVINIDGSVPAKAASRAVESRDGDTPAFDWIIACEDLGTIDDYDFNDIVIGINAVAREGYTQVKITPLAAGGTIAAHVFLKDEDLGEIHNLIKEGSPVTMILNTYDWDTPGKPISRNLTNWNMSDIMGNITIAVTGHGNASTTIITPPDKGTAPQMICVAGDWQWPGERYGINEAYNGFTTWAGTPVSEMTDEILAWPSNPTYTNEVISWSIPQDTDPDPDPENPGEDPNDDPNDDTDPYDGIERQSLNMIENQGYAWSSGWKHDTKTWDYVPGLVTKSMLTYCEQFDDYEGNAFTWAKGYADKAYTGNTFNTSAFIKGQLDNIASGKVVLSLYRMANEGKGGMTATDAEKYKSAADTIYNYLKKGYPRIASGLEGAGGFYHKYDSNEDKSYTNQMWLDGLYMGAAFYAEYLATVHPEDESAGWTDIYNQFNIIHTHTYDSDKQLNYHGWATTKSDGKYDKSSFWAKTTTPNKGCSKEFWGRGMGWYFAALVDVLEYMPKDNPNYNNLKNIYIQVAQGLKRWRDTSSGVWYQLLQYDASKTASSRTVSQDLLLNITKDSDGKITAVSVKDEDLYNSNPLTAYFYIKDSKGNIALSSDKKTLKYEGKWDQPLTNQANYLEASASCMFTYGFLKGLRLGLIDEATYGNVAEKAYNGVLTQFTVQSDGKVTGTTATICKSAGLGPYTELCRDGSVESYLVGYDVVKVANEGKGIGAFIFASLEWEKRQAGVKD